MEPILPQIGADLGKLVLKANLPTVNLISDVPVQVIRNNQPISLLDFMYLWFRRPMRSLFLVGDDLEYINSFVNSLALLATNHKELKKLFSYMIDKYDLTNGTQLPKNNLAENMATGLGKHLYSVNIDKLLILGNQKKDWDQILPKLIQEAHEQNYFLVINDMHRIFDKQNSEHEYLAQCIFFLTRAGGNTKLTFLAPLTWENYVNHIENGRMTNIIQYRRPIFFSPRPDHLKLSQNVRWIYDDDYIYKSSSPCK